MSDASNFTIRISRLKEFESSLRQSPDVLRRHLVTAVNRITTEGEARSKRYVPVDTGHLRRSITMAPATFAGGSVRGQWGTNVPYAEAVEKGRGAGKPMPPTGALLGWMARHGVSLTDAKGQPIPLARAEFVIRRAIGRRGIAGRPYLVKAFDEIKPLARREFRAALTRALTEIGGGGGR